MLRRPVALLVLTALFGPACDEVGGTVYCCSYESRHTGCGGVGWNEWTAESFEFDIDDYRDDWDADRVCNQFSGSDTSCSDTCCIDIQYQNTDLSRGTCS